MTENKTFIELLTDVWIHKCKDSVTFKEGEFKDSPIMNKTVVTTAMIFKQIYPSQVSLLHVSIFFAFSSSTLKIKGRKSGLDIVSSPGCLVVPSSIFYYKYIIKVSSCARHPWKSLRKASERGTILGGVNVVFIRGSNKVPATPRLLSLSAWSKFQIDVFYESSPFS